MKKIIRKLSYDVSKRPFMVIWEVTRSCDLACQHCRATAIARRDPEELSFEEGKALLHQVKDFGLPRPILVFTGGDPFKRPDLFELISYGERLDLAMAASPSGTPLLTRESLLRLKESSIKAISLSIDGHNPALHDRFRGVSGSFELTDRGWNIANDIGLKVQINTTVTKHNVGSLPEIFRLLVTRRVMTWSVFFLIGVGRGEQLQDLSPEEYEAVMHFLYDCSKYMSIKTTEGHHYKRVVLERTIHERQGSLDYLSTLPAIYFELRNHLEDIVREEGLTSRASIHRPPLNINAGKGFVFVSHKGEVQPSGFLPLTAGNVRSESLVDIYRHSPIFKDLRDESRLHGACGCCEFRTICGGSRSRAYAFDGNPLAHDPSCSYQPGSFPFQKALEHSALFSLLVFCLLTIPLFSSLALNPALAESGSAREATESKQSVSPLDRFLDDGSYYLKFRYRYENDDQDGLTKEAHASTLRSVLGLQTPVVSQFKAHLEIEDVSEIGDDAFNNTINGKIDRPVVADVEGTEVNILRLESTHLPDTAISAGRYQKVLDNARFIGDVAWRQNHQTFDGASLTNTSLENAEFFYGYLSNINRIFGDDSPVGDVDSKSHLFHFNIKPDEILSLTTYSYLLDLKGLPAASSETFGGFALGAIPLNETFSLVYDTEYAHQSDYGDNATSFDAHYYRLIGGVQVGPIRFEGGQELLGSDDGKIGFSTPLATLHQWNGWADKFLTTPENGLEDTYARLSYTSESWSEDVGKTTAQLLYHSFHSDEGDTYFGEEWNIDIVQEFLKRYFFGVRIADYRAGNFASDTRKVIFSLGASFQSS